MLLRLGFSCFWGILAVLRGETPLGSTRWCYLEMILLDPKVSLPSSTREESFCLKLRATELVTVIRRGEHFKESPLDDWLPGKDQTYSYLNYIYDMLNMLSRDITL